MQVRRTRALHRPIAERWMQRCREKCARLRQNRTIQRYPREPCRAPNDPARASKTRAEIQYLFFFFFFLSRGDRGNGSVNFPSTGSPVLQRTINGNLSRASKKIARQPVRSRRGIISFTVTEPRRVLSKSREDISRSFRVRNLHTVMRALSSASCLRASKKHRFPKLSNPFVEKFFPRETRTSTSCALNSPNYPRQYTIYAETISGTISGVDSRDAEGTVISRSVEATKLHSRAVHRFPAYCRHVEDTGGEDAS